MFENGLSPFWKSTRPLEQSNGTACSNSFRSRPGSDTNAEESSFIEGLCTDSVYTEVTGSRGDGHYLVAKGIRGMTLQG